MVEWKKIGDVCDVFAGGDLPSTYIKGNMPSEECIFPIYSNGVEEKSLYGFSDSYRVDKASITISARGTIGYHCIRKPYFTPIVRLITLIPKNIKNLNLSYLNEVLFNSNIDGTKGGIPQLTVPTVSRLLIPIPSIHEQERIVGILNTFTSSIDNLKQQITQRRKQYEYYRDQLLDLEGKEGVEMKTLKDVFDTRNGYTPSTSNNQFWDDGIIPWFKMEDIRDNGRILNDSNLHITTSAIKGKGLFKANSIILATSATIGEHALITVEHLSNQRFTNFYPKECYLNIINMKFVYYYMYRIDEWCKQHINQGGFASVDMGGLYNLEIPIPSFQEQQRIVSILDTFEASIQNLEAQLSQREKQYEYYRNKLLTF